MPFDSTGWAGSVSVESRSTAIKAVPGLVYLDLSYLPEEWWDEVAEDGADIRVSDPDGDEVPIRLIAFDYAGSAGQIQFGGGGLSTSESKTYQVWSGNSSATFPSYDIFSDSGSPIAVLMLGEDVSGSPPQGIDATGNGHDATWGGDTYAPGYPASASYISHGYGAGYDLREWFESIDEGALDGYFDLDLTPNEPDRPTFEAKIAAVHAALAALRENDFFRVVYNSGTGDTSVIETPAGKLQGGSFHAGSQNISILGPLGEDYFSTTYSGPSSASSGGDIGPSTKTYDKSVGYPVSGGIQGDAGPSTLNLEYQSDSSQCVQSIVLNATDFSGTIELIDPDGMWNPTASVPISSSGLQSLLEGLGVYMMNIESVTGSGTVADPFIVTYYGNTDFPLPQFNTSGVTYTGTPSYVTPTPAKIGLSDALDGGDDYWSMPIGTALNSVGAGDFTIFGWIKPIAVTHDQNILFWASDDGDDVVSLKITPTGELIANVGGASATSGTLTNYGQWNLVGFRRSTGGGLAILHDGFANPGSGGSLDLSDIDNALLWLGSAYNSSENLQSGSSFSGFLNEFRFYDRALSDDEFETVWNNEDDPEGIWEFGEWAENSSPDELTLLPLEIELSLPLVALSDDLDVLDLLPLALDLSLPLITLEDDSDVLTLLPLSLALDLPLVTLESVIIETHSRILIFPVPQMALIKNTTGQRWMVLAVNSSTGEMVTGDAANITATIRKAYGAFVATNDVHPDEIGGGYYEFLLTQAETNADQLTLLAVSSTENVTIIPLPSWMVTLPPGFTGLTTTAIDQLLTNKIIPHCLVDLSTSLGETVKLTIEARDAFGRRLSIDTLGTEYSASVTVREFGAAEEVALFTETFDEDDLIDGQFEKLHASPGFTSGNPVTITVELTIDGITYTNTSPVSVVS